MIKLIAVYDNDEQFTLGSRQLAITTDDDKIVRFIFHFSL